MNTNTPSERLTERKRAAILDAAIKEFLAAGYDATSMDRIAARANVSKRTVYNHFPGKEALFAAILHRLWDATCTVGVSAYRADVPLREQLLVLLDRKLRLLSDEAFLALARVAIGAVIHSPERSRDMVERIGEREEDLTVWIRAAAAAGRLSAPDPEFAAHQLHGIVKAFAFWPQVTLGQPPLEVAQQQKVAQAAADMFLTYYGRPADADLSAPARG
ncbi:TetR/AcrR family transcriptional regulator [Burkholderia vietnamiensis]|uniref:TetR/AcrR family transcriptional regulator n=1 Tax=Burkholderia vietnamiensis TaxID=60552 RepID=UPI001D141233|nr:TetR/AcrR family transcriptional regulator [Burkholderia vietnamiensis]UEB99180.1 TetR/AcrR family transcriptional regulator [Burkholderia vietnamiensis]HEF4839767.1 TetR/AcrR family transcriptional regulator [Burkholderia vietnamiensis]